MAPITGGDHKAFIQEHIANNKIMIFSKTTCPFCKKVKDLFDSLGAKYFALELDQIENGPSIHESLKEFSKQGTVPNVYINGNHIGGCDATLALHNENKLFPMLAALDGEETYEYDLVVIGGGSGGLAASKEAANLGFKVACLDFVKPSPQGTTWGLGGTCVNVGCIPKKLMHQAAILGHSLSDARLYGWEFGTEVKHQWATMRDAIQAHIGSLNWNYRVQLRNNKVTYMNAYAQFIGPHKILATDKKGKSTEVTGKYFLIATGGRPRYPDIPGCKEYAVSSDDLFKLPYCPGKTVVVGASYVALECAGFLAGIGLDVSIIVRSILLRGFDQQCAEKIGEYMSEHGVKFIRPCVPTKIEQLEAPKDDQPGLHRITAKMSDGEEVTLECNTVLFAIGRNPCTNDLNLEQVGVKVNPNTGYIVGNDDESTTCPYIFAVGDVLEGRPELTPVAIQAGRLLTRRLFANQTLKCDYDNIPTTVFTPLEYGAIGLSEEDAIAKYGEQDIEVYHSNFMPLEWTVAKKEANACYAKLICVKSKKELVVGFHVLGPNAGEITQGFTMGLKLGATKADFDNAIGIHPTCAEIFTTMDVTKSSGGDTTQAGC